MYVFALSRMLYVYFFVSFFFFFNDTATTEIYTLSLHDALPISLRGAGAGGLRSRTRAAAVRAAASRAQRRHVRQRSEEHTSELQSQSNIVCRLLLEKKKNNTTRANDASARHHSTWRRTRENRLS